MRLQTFSYRFAEEVLHGKLALKREVEEILLDRTIDPATLSRPNFNEVLPVRFVAKGGRTRRPYSMSPIRCTTIALLLP